MRRRLLLADSFHQVVASNADRLVISAAVVSVGTDRAVVVVAGYAVEDSRRSIHARVLSGCADFTRVRAAEHAPRLFLFVQFTRLRHLIFISQPTVLIFGGLGFTLLSRGSG